MRKYKILYLASEVFPFARTGGLGDVAGALPKALKDLGHEVRVMLPKYKCINERKYVIREVIRLKDINIPIGDEAVEVNVKSSFIPDSKVQVYFVDYKEYFARDGLYVDPKTNKDFPDNAERFIVFCKAVLETLKLLGWQPDIIHCNDWQTALIPLYLKTVLKNDPFFKKISSVLTVHNLAFQGNFDPSVYKKIDSKHASFEIGGLSEYYGKYSFLKTGIHYSDIITTVSETYAKEIQNSGEYGYGLEKLLKKRSKDVYGIMNGVDDAVWGPAEDTNIYENYSSKNLSVKEENKKGLLEEVRLSYDKAAPLIGIVSRLTDQKGFDLIKEVADELMQLDLRIIVLGLGETRYHDLMKELQKKYKDKISVHLAFDDKLAHKIEAGSDMFLMPSRYEPCGLNQLYSMMYGTVPVVRATGGLADSVIPFNAKTGSGTGFSFEEYDSGEMLETLKSAIALYTDDKKSWKKLMRNGMRCDYSWQNSAKKYAKLYETAYKSKTK